MNTIRPNNQLRNKIILISLQPLLEMKSNERLRLKALSDMKLFYYEISEYWNGADSNLHVVITHCFRCIANGGKDPSILRSDVIPWVGDGSKKQVTDASLIQSVLRDKDYPVLRRIVTELESSMDNYKITSQTLFESMRKFSTQQVSDQSQLYYTANVVDSNVRDTFSGKVEGTIEITESPAVSPTVPVKTENNVINPATFFLDNGGEINPTVVLKKQKHNLSLIEKVVHEILALCRDLSVDLKCAAVLCSVGICKSLFLYLDNLLVGESISDKRIGVLIDLLWSILDSYLSDEAINWNKNQTNISEKMDSMNLDDDMDNGDDSPGDKRRESQVSVK